MKKEEEILEHYQYADREAWMQALQKNPDKSWLKSRELGRGRTSSYVPLGIQQAIGDKFFRECDVYEENYQVVVNEIICTVKVNILPDFPYAEHRRISGTGAKPIQSSSGSSAASFPTGKIANALEYNAAAARAAALSNALTTFANIFGRNLNREISSDFSFIRSKPVKTEEDEKQ